MTTVKPTLLLIHGAWHSPSHYERLTSLLTKAGYPTLCPTLPTFDAKPHTKSLPDDAALIHSTLVQLIDEEHKDVIVIMHSYGGVVGTEAVTEELSKVAREKKGLKGGVVRLLFIAAFMVRSGESLVTPLGGALPPFITVDENGLSTMLEPAARFYHDLPVPEQEHWVSLLRPCPASSQLTPISNIGYKYVSSTYLFCEDDQALPVEAQKQMVESNEGDSFGGKSDRVSCGASHSPFLSMPERVVEVVEGLVK